MLVISAIILPSISVGADTGSSTPAKVVGTVSVLSNNIDTTYKGSYLSANKGEVYEYTARIYSAPVYNNDGTKVNCSWHYASKSGVYSITDNIFSLTAVGTAITTEYRGQTLSWNPIVMVGSTEYTAKGAPTLLAIDPVNSNYRNNTLEWDYGICVRHLRVIEGMTQETWIFDENPHGTVWIKDNTTKSAGFIWQVAPYAYDANGNVVVINEYKQVSSSEFERVDKEGGYPVVIDPTETYISSSYDAELYAYGVANYTTVHDATSAVMAWDGFEFKHTGQRNASGTSWSIYRSGIFFNTSALPNDANISSAKVGLYGASDNSITDFNITLQVSSNSSYPHEPMVVGDYNCSLYSGDGGNISTSGFNLSGYNNISMTATGLTWISLTGTTKLLIRSSNDIASTAPTGDEYIDTCTYEKGAGYQPFLEVTYTIPEGDIYLTTASDTHGNVSDPGEAGSPYAYSPNTSVNISATADACYHFVNWTGNTTDIDDVNASSTHIHMGTGNKSVTANFAIDVKTVTYSAGAGGSVNGSWPENVNCGSNGSWVLASPNANYHFVNWSDASTTNPRHEVNVTSNLSYTANFAIDVKTVTYSAGAGGTVNGSWPENVNYGSNSSWVLATNNSCYHFVNWSDASTTNPRQEVNVTSNLSFTANFVIDVQTVTYSAGAHGSVNGSWPENVNCGSNSSWVLATANANYHFVDWSDTSVTNPRHEVNVTSNLSYTANFTLNVTVITETYYSNAYDGYIKKEHSNYTTAHDATLATVYDTSAIAWLGQKHPGGEDYTIYRDYFFFNTSALPDNANISSAKVGLYGASDSTTVDFNITLQTSSDTDYPHQPIDSGDYNYSLWSGDGGNLSTAGFTTVGYNNISMSATGLTWISLTGDTKFCVRSDRDISSTAPSFSEYVGIYCNEQGAGYKPFLEITYTVPDTNVYLTTSSGSGGNVSNPGEGEFNYIPNESVDITATADACYHFVNWTGNTSDIDNVNSASTHIHMGTGDKTATSNFAVDVKTVTYGAGAHGSINGSWPENVNCGSNSSWVLATANSCYHFVNWSDASTTNPRQEVNVTSNVSYTANFAINVSTVTYSAGAGGSVNGSWPENVNCGSNSSWVLASPSACYYFVNWSDSSTTNPRHEVNVTSNLSYTANFALSSLSVTYSAGAGGTVNGSWPENLNCGDNSSWVLASPNSGQHFVNWNDSSTTNPRHEVNVTTNLSFVANFAPNVLTVTYIAGAGGSVNGSWPENVDYGNDSSWVLATPNLHYHFVDWSDASTTNPRHEVNVATNLSFTANFAIDTHTVTYSAGAGGSVNGSWPETVDYGDDSSWVLASPNACYHFVNWSDASTTNPRRETNVTSNLSFTANFAIYVYNLTTASGANGNVTTPGESVYPHNCGDVVNLVATENVGYHFVNWTGDTGGILDVNDPTTTITVTANASISANFGIDVTDPAVTTNSATYVLVSSARLNGLLSSDGGEACNVGFEYSLWNGSAWGTAVATANQSKVSGETFFNDLSGLANSSTYRFRALAGNSHSAVYGAYINFSTTTTVYPPTNMLCNPHSTSIDLSWTKGVNSVNTSIRWKTGSYPTDILDGTALPNQSGGSYTHTGLASGTSYYYRLWGLDGTVVSTTNSTFMCTTLAPGANESALPTAVSPPNWAGAIDDSKLVDLPIYGIGNEIADTTGIPHATFWMWSGMGFLIIASILIYNRTKSIFLTVLLATVAMVALGVLKVVPLLAVAIFLLGVFALIAKEWHQAGREAG